MTVLADLRDLLERAESGDDTAYAPLRIRLRNAADDLLACADALADVHERLCGCDDPGRTAFCVAGIEFEVLRRMSAGKAETRP